MFVTIFSSLVTEADMSRSTLERWCRAFFFSVVLTSSISNAIARPNTIGPQNGWLMLEGGGRLRNAATIRKFVALAEGPNARLVSIDTAALALSRQRFDGAYITNQQRWIGDVFGIKNVSVLHTFSRDEANSESFVEPLRHATAVWIWGGSHEALARVYTGTRTQKAIRAVLDRGGIVGGSSAGAMILGSYLVARDHEAGPSNPEGSHHLLLHHPLDAGFGFVPNLAVNAHVASRHREQDLGQIISKRPELLGIGIDETTAVLVHDDDCQVVGEGKVWIWDSRQHDGHGYIILHAGQHFRLGARPVTPSE